MTTPADHSIQRSTDFEFEALAVAKNYRSALIREFSEFLHGDVVEVGAGIGQVTEELVRLSAVKRAVAVEPNKSFCALHRQTYPRHHVIEGTARDLPRGENFDAILSVNVLEHIQDDEGELARYHELLLDRVGHLCLFVPARPEIYSPIDKDFGHFRRYTRADLRQKLRKAGFKAVRLNYFNFVGYFAWWLNFCLLKKRVFERAKVRLFDRLIFPLCHLMESRLLRPPIGQSLLAIAQSTATAQI